MKLPPVFTNTMVATSPYNHCYQYCAQLLVGENRLVITQDNRSREFPTEEFSHGKPKEVIDFH